MDNFINNMMNYINENTTLLIIICVFLIFVLIVYLIDNSIKSKKLEKMQQNQLNKNESKEIISEANIPNKVEESTKNEIEDIPKPLESIEEKVDVEEDLVIPSPIDFSSSNKIDEEKQNDNSEEFTDDIYKPVEGTSNELLVDPSINDILLKDFTKNDTIKEIEEEDNDIDLNPIKNISRIEPEDVEVPEVSSKVDEVQEEKKPLYKNDKKLSDIFSKKKESKDELLNTVSLENELDKILSKLNTESNESNDSTLDETMDFSNMF